MGLAVNITKRSEVHYQHGHDIMPPYPLASITRGASTRSMVGLGRARGVSPTIRHESRVFGISAAPGVPITSDAASPLIRH